MMVRSDRRHHSASEDRRLQIFVSQVSLSDVPRRRRSGIRSEHRRVQIRRLRFPSKCRSGELA